MKASTNSRYSEDEEGFALAVLELFPEGVAAAIMRGQGDPASLLPAEALQLGRAVPKRAREFAAGRQCARRALAEMGITDFAVRAAPDRQPIWPETVVGSISHTDGLCAAVVADRRCFAAIGLDCETVGDVTDDVRATVCTPGELSWVDSLRVVEQPTALTLLFSAKEAFYKCQYPLTREWLDFHDLVIEPLNWGSEIGGFEVNALRRLAVIDHAHGPFVGRYLLRDGYLTAGIAMAAAPS